MTIDDLPDPAAPFAIDPSALEAIRHVVNELGDSHCIIGRSPVDGTFPFQQTVGMQEFLTRMVTDAEFVNRAVDVYVNRWGRPASASSSRRVSSARLLPLSLCFFGGLNGETLIEATPQMARAEVEYAIRHAAQGGGLVMPPATCYNPEPSWKIIWQHGRRHENSAPTPAARPPGGGTQAAGHYRCGLPSRALPDYHAAPVTTTRCAAGDGCDKKGRASSVRRFRRPVVR